MVCEMEIDNIEEMEMEEPLPSMWPEDIDSDKQFNIEKPGQDQEMLEEVMTIKEKPKSKSDFDLKTLSKLINFTDTGSNQLANLAKHWEYKQANVVRLLKEELDILNKQKEAVELKKLEILEEHRFESESYGGDKRPISILDEVHQLWDPDVPAVKKLLGAVVESKRVETEAEFDTLVYWKQRALHSDKLLEASVVREQILVEKLQECIKSIERQEKPVDELSEILKRADNFLHFVLQNAPVVIGHQDKELRYRFIYNHFPTLGEQDIIGKTDVEIFNGAGVKESQDFKREVLEKGKPAKREITFETELFGLKTFLIYVEPVFNKAGETIGINYMGMEVSDQVIKREKMAKLREEIAVQKAKETELNKTIHITEETMRAKQMLATMSHEIRSPLSGVVSMAEILTTTKLDREQRQLLEVMLSSGDLVLQLINDILDLSKVESGVMKLEATKFRPRQVVKHVLQTAAASLQKSLTLEGYVTEDVPVEVIGDVLRIRQILTNLISNAVKFTHEGKVGIKLRMVEGPTSAEGETCLKKSNGVQQNGCDQEGFCSNEPYQNGLIHDELSTPASMNGDKEEETQSSETKTVWLRCDVYDTGIGIPENALSTLFRRYMQVSADHARKYGGTGLGLAICKQLVELMGGQLTVSSKEHCGSTFTFVLPYTLSVSSENSDPDELTDMADYEDSVTEDEVAESYFQFQPRALNSLFSSNGTSRTPKLLPQKLNGLSQISYSFPQYSLRPEEMASGENGYPAVDDVAETLSKPESSVSQIPNAKYESPPRSRSENSRSDSNHPEERRVNGFLAKTGESQETCKRQVTFADADADADADSECSSGSSSKIPKSTLKPKILLVEDSKINIMVAQSMMKQLGQTIEVVNNGAEAVRAVQCCSYDLILMDVQMPIMDGLQATRIIRAFEETGNWNTTWEAGIEQPEPSSLQNGHKPFAKRIPIIAMTANAFSESAEECFANGMDSFVPKPVTRQKLKEKLEQYLPDFNLG